MYATSQRLLLYYDQGGESSVEELSYQYLTGVELVRKASHPMMLLGLTTIFGAIFLTLSGLIYISAFLALGGGVLLLLYGSKGNIAYFQLHISRPARAISCEPPTEMEVALQRLKGVLGIRPAEVDERWRLDYLTGKSFIATVRHIKGNLTEF